MKNSDNVDAKIGVLVVNLGTPKQATTRAVKQFLREFLVDPRVIDLPRIPWKLLLNMIILPLRSKRVAKNYQKIWTDRGSPLLFHTQDIVNALNQSLKDKNYYFSLAMSYGQPSIRDGLLALRSQGIKKLLVLPLYPQYSSTTTASVFDLVTKALLTCPNLPEFRFIKDYYVHPLYIKALANTITSHLCTAENNPHLLFSFHGLPVRYCEKGDPYTEQCFDTAKALAKALSLRDTDYSICFQSQFGKAKWLRPSTESTLMSLAKQGHKSVAIIAPGFACDCLETLEEIAIGLKQTFLACGGEFFSYIPALNASSSHIDLLKDLVMLNSQAW